MRYFHEHVYASQVGGSRCFFADPDSMRITPSMGALFTQHRVALVRSSSMQRHLPCRFSTVDAQAKPTYLEIPSESMRRILLDVPVYRL